MSGVGVVFQDDRGHLEFAAVLIVHGLSGQPDAVLEVQFGAAAVAERGEGKLGGVGRGDALAGGV